MIRRVGTLLLLLLSMLLPSHAASPAVAILGSPGSAAWNSDVQTKLQGTGFFSTVDVIAINTTTPSLATLQQYAAVLVYSDSPGYANATALGNNLADYHDAGGGVVMAVFAVASIPLAGRFHTANYYALNPLGQAQPGGLTLGTIYEPASPLLAGVTSFNGGTSSYHGTGAVDPAAVRVADWSNGRPLILRRTIGGRPRVDLNFFPPSSDARSDFWVSSSGGARIIANALLFVAGATTTTTVPTVSDWTLAGLALLICGSGALLLRRRTA
jgi:hypothetical protein